jgi:hypothetical protein
MLSLLGVAVIVTGHFLLADRFGGPIGESTVPSGNQTTGSPPPVDPDKLRSPHDVAQAWVDLWNAGNHATMYDLLSATAKQRITLDDFVKRYQDID